MALVRVTDRFISDKRSADFSVREQLKFVHSHLEELRSVDKNCWKARRAQDLMKDIEKGLSLTDTDRRIVEGLYEDVMGALGLEKVNTHVDRKVRGLRYG